MRSRRSCALGSLVGAGLLLACRGGTPSEEPPAQMQPTDLDAPPVAPLEADGDSAVKPTRSASPGGDMILIAGQTGVRPAAGFERVDVPDFWLDRTEVTVEAYAGCVRAGACDPVNFEHEGCMDRRGVAADMPVTCVSHAQADQFCRRDGKRLPAPAEFSLVTKAMRVHSCEDAVIGSVDGDPCGRTGPSPVGSTPGDATSQGVRDLVGNVSEWTAPFSPPDAPEDASYWSFGHAYLGNDAVWPKFDEIARGAVFPWLGFRCARSDDDARDRGKAEARHPRPHTRSPLKAPWVARAREHRLSCEPLGDNDKLCRRGCAGFEADPDCLDHCELACEKWDNLPCARREERCLRLHSTCGCAVDDAPCQRDCEKRCLEAVQYVGCDDGPEPGDDEG